MREVCKLCDGTGKLGFQREGCCGCGGTGFIGKDTPRVFLGGTCNESTWRDDLIELLTIDYFNPVVDDWTEECMAEEIHQRETCDYCLYVITPRMTGVYSIAEVIDDSNKKPEKTIFCFLDMDKSDYKMKADNDGNTVRNYVCSFDKAQKKSLTQVGKMVERNGGKFFNSLQDVADFLNKCGDK